MKGFWPGVAIGSLCAVGLALYFGMNGARARRPAERWRSGALRSARGRLRVIGRPVGF